MYACCGIQGTQENRGFSLGPSGTFFKILYKEYIFMHLIHTDLGTWYFFIPLHLPRLWQNVTCNFTSLLLVLRAELLLTELALHLPTYFTHHDWTDKHHERQSRDVPIRQCAWPHPTEMSPGKHASSEPSYTPWPSGLTGRPQLPLCLQSSWRNNQAGNKKGFLCRSHARKNLAPGVYVP